MLNKFFNLRKILTLVLVSLGLVSNASAGTAMKWPFDPKNVGQTYTFEVNVVEHHIYSVDLRFFLTVPNKWSHFLDKKADPQEAKRFNEVLGMGGFVDHIWIEPGVPVKLRVQIIQKSDGQVVLDELISRPKTMASGYGRYADLARKSLPVGTYSIRIDYLEGAPELASWPAEILFTRAHHGK